MLVTVNTDASYYGIHKVGGFAFWISSNQKRIQQSGLLKSAKSAQEAEIMCIANALYALLHSGITGVHKVIINCDCKWAFNAIKNKAKAGTPERHAADLLKQLKKAHGVIGKPIHEFRYVAAHTGVNDARSYVNEWCDSNAKRWPRREINKMEGRVVFPQV